jgi:formylglycine-generating enzyme
MKTRMLSLVFLLWQLGQLQAQTKLTFLPGGTVEMGDGYQFVYEGHRMRLIEPDEKFSARNAAGPLIGDLPMSNVPKRQVTVSSFFLSPKEVTNGEYRAFLRDSLLKGDARAAFETGLKAANKDNDKRLALWDGLYRQAAAQGLFPDTACWRTDFPTASNGPLVTHYFRHPAFDDYPVVGVSWDQANAYCAWLSRHNNATRAEKDLPPQPNFRLPTEAEWEYAALGEVPGKHVYQTWLQPQNTPKGLAYTASIKTAPTEYFYDNYMYTAPTGKFPANPFGLYDMAGNVAEWTLDAFRPLRALGAPEPEAGYSDLIRVVKGGSWADYWQATIPGSRCAQDGSKGAARVGFRVAMSYVPDSGSEY